MRETTGSPRGWLFVLAYILLWATFLVALISTSAFSAGEAIAAFVILGLIFPALAWLATWNYRPLDSTVHAPRTESWLLLGYLLFLAVVLVKGFGAVAQTRSEPLHSLELFALKILVFVILPAYLIGRIGGYSLRELFPVSLQGKKLLPALWLSLASVAMQAFLGRGLRDIHDAGLPSSTIAVGSVLSFLFLLFETGLVEEFFFRTLLQERLSAWMKSPWGGLIVSVLLFGLVHAPGFYLRPAATQEALGPHPSLFLAVGYSIVITSVAGLFLGVLWMRTRNLAVVVIVHAATDFLPNLVPFCKDFHLIH